MLQQVRLNEIEVDAFGRINGVFAVDKPRDKTSHDIVYFVRKKVGTRKVGHAGALDPFATGVLLVLVGKYTKATEELMNWDKEYKCTILFGTKTDTLDVEGKILSLINSKEMEIRLRELSISHLNTKLKDISSGYSQRVPVFSSVKVGGTKLREMARKSDSFSIDETGLASFYKNNEVIKQISLPSREVKFDKFIFSNLVAVDTADLPQNLADKIKDFAKDNSIAGNQVSLATVELEVSCSKGTYIRQLAEDIGERLGLPAMLVSLERTRLGNIRLENCLKPEEIPEYKPQTI